MNSHDLPSLFDNRERTEIPRCGISGLSIGQSFQEGVITKRRKEERPLSSLPSLDYIVIQEVSDGERMVSVRRESRSVRTFNYVILGKKGEGRGERKGARWGRNKGEKREEKKRNRLKQHSKLLPNKTGNLSRTLSETAGVQPPSLFFPLSFSPPLLRRFSIN